MSEPGGQGPARLEVRDLVVAYGQAVVIDKVSFRVDPGQCLGVVGANGAGKSSLFRSIAGLVRPRSGAIQMDGRDITQEPPWKLAGRGLTLVPESRELFGGLSVLENLNVAARRLPLPERGRAIDSALSLFPALQSIRTRRARVLSGGEQQMLAIARAMACNPSMLLLDEPSLGLAPAVVSTLLASLKLIQSTGVSILISEQSLRIPQELCDRILVCAGGRIVAEGSPTEVLTDATLRHAFLGA